MSSFLKSNILRFAKSEKGSGTAFCLFLTVCGLMVGGYAVDVGNAMMSRTQLQIAADAAGHAALLKRELGTEAEAIDAANAVAIANMPTAAFGTVLRNADIVFGNYNPDTWTFTPASGSRKAVQVTTRLTAANGNAIQTYLMKLVGLDEWNLTTTSIFTTYIPSCLREGFVAEDVVDLQSNNSFTNGFCVHSNNFVSLNSNNYFEPGTVVSMPNPDEIELPNSGFKTNTGLQDALREGSWNIRIIKRIDALINGLEAFDKLYIPAYINSGTKVTLPSKFVTQADLIPGRVHTYSCSGGAGLTIKSNVLVKGVVIITSCDVKFEQGVVLENAVIATRSTGSKSFSAASGVQIGKDDKCAVGGGAQLVTRGSMSFPADLKIYGGQLLAYDDINFAANANGIQGAALVAGGVISGTSNMAMGFCGKGMENNFQAEYFKLVY